MSSENPQSIFQLTPSRRATISASSADSRACHFNSRPHGGRLLRFVLRIDHSYFNSRPHGGRPDCVSFLHGQVDISTHALTEGDQLQIVDEADVWHFNSRPHGGRRFSAIERFLSNHFNSRPHGGRQVTERNLNFHGYFNSRPHGGRRVLHSDHKSFSGISTHALTEGDFPCEKKIRLHCISTHALTEGDCKFRQIFLLNRGYAYSISLYFLPHFISLLPQILSFQQKPFKFQVRIFLLFSVHLAFALQNQCVHHVKSRFCTNMFYFVFVLFTQIVKSQTISLFIYDFF